MTTTRNYKQLHEPTDEDRREAFAWQQDFEKSDLLEKAIPATERYSGAGIKVLQRTAFYQSQHDEMEAILELAIRVDMPRQTAANQAYWQIAKALRTLAVEMLVALGEDTSETIGDVLLKSGYVPEPDECGQDWLGAVTSAWFYLVAGAFAGFLLASALKWNDIF